MSVQRSEEYELILRELTHEWVTVEDLIEKLTPRIPPGKAKRAYEDAAEISAAYRKGKGENVGSSGRVFTEDRMIESGARSLLRKAIVQMKKTAKVLEDEVDGVRAIRANVFDAEYIDQVLAARPAPVRTPAPPLPPPVQHAAAPDGFFPLMYDHRSVKRDIKVQANLDTGVIVVTVADVQDGIDLDLCFSPLASDWVSDQLGMQSMLVRGRENKQKIFPARKH